MASEYEKPAETPPVTHERRPFKGSCHCGTIQYIVYLTVPYVGQQSPEKLYKCNCRICHKSGFMHLRVPDKSKDFLLLSPLDPFKELGDYQCVRNLIHFFFCKTCGIRCFNFLGERRVREVEIESDVLSQPVQVKDGPKKKAVKAYHMVPDDEVPKTRHGQYLSVNGHTIDPNQEGFDMRDWTEKNGIHYYDFLNDENVKESRYDKPHEGGCY